MESVRGVEEEKEGGQQGSGEVEVRETRGKRKTERKGRWQEGYAAVEMAWGTGMKGRRMQVQSTALGTLAPEISK